MSDPNFESRFVLRRKELELTQEDISNAIGISVRSISYWERGTHMPKLNPIQMAKLCDILKCSIQELASDFEEIAGSH
jgi:transcriptional regulator with XRE-family HTH domain